MPQDQVGLLLQAESAAGIASWDDILALDGVAGIFTGPEDLAADFDYLGNTGARSKSDHT